MSITEREVRDNEDVVELPSEKGKKKNRKFSNEPRARWLIVALVIVAISAAASLFIYEGGLSSSPSVSVPSSLPTFPKVGGHKLLPSAGKTKTAASTPTSKTTVTTLVSTSSKNPFTPIVNTSSTPGSAPQG